MKLMFLAEKFAGAPMLRIEYGREGVFFTGDAPDIYSLITVDLPGLRSPKADAIRAWLVEHNAGGKKRRQEDATLHPDRWRKAVLDDYLVAGNAASYVWNVATQFTLAEIATFAEQHAPRLDAEIRAAIKTPREKRPAALAKVNQRAELIVPILYAGQRRIPAEVEELKAELDREEVATLVKATKDPMAWISACRSLRSDTVKNELLVKIAKQLVKTKADERAIAAALDAMIEKGLSKLYAPELFATLGHRIPLPQNVAGQTIDVTKARETTVPANWETYKARRIGPVKIGRGALVLYDGSKLTYIRGERKLKHAIKRRGGSIKRWGNTLTIAAKDPASVGAALLRVDEIDSLAQLAPARAVALLPEPAVAGPIADALARAATDPRWRRILADLLIERLVGIDADVARRLARAEARANRR